ncbi:MAG: Uncharacterized protein Athens101426_148 [Parcubacteria group bacterium Athens1014_26]|nr:MAG: Uncharacterized protein Athens101426_148 [Parcubacteria group bacterium Athens1014_26]
MPFYQIFKSFTKIERYVFWGVFIMFIVASSFWGFSFFDSHTIKVPVSSGQYTEGIIGQPTFINPVISSSNEVDNDLSEIVYSDLIKLSDHYKVSPDGKTWNVVLKSDLLWDDGKPLTSDDVIFTIDTIQNPDAISPLYQTWQGVVAQRISELEIEFNLRSPYAFFLDNLKDLKIIPRHIFGAIPAANLRLSTYNLEPVGSGPYKFISYNKRKDAFITGYNFEINKNYASDKPYINNLSIKFYPNTEELIKAFNSRDIDGFGNLNPKNLNELKLTHQLIEIKMPRYYAIFLNAASNIALQDQNVKNAMELALNRKKIISDVFDGKALEVTGPLPPVISGYSPENISQEFSLEKSRDLLEKNGWLINNETGIREKTVGKNTVKLEFDIIVPQIPFLVETVNIIKDDWQNAGIKLNPIVLSPADISEEIIKTRNYQMLIFGNILKNNPDIFSFWHSSERFYPGLNLSLYENKKVDDLLESIRKNTDEITRNNDLKTLQTIITDDKPALFLFSPNYLYIAPNNLNGFEEKNMAMPSNRFDNINKWYLKTTRVFK